ncbi:FadR/GntR family transcriptional regulator [Pseudoalteromonas marina]|uniref:FadR/GntR family transcriptional regulator n=1 Tax=Pseudoalteromonas marina TaxID=267375 RepID=A0ABT9FFV4_9GAMM|nr:FadR/GntR family transcriptional regulator [Pseudoalteromonas marina]MDP2565672.1 FadR/GntR family transcriptional regulator [Pseudoalteromonas marina]
MKTQPRQNLTHQLTHDLGFAIVRGVYPVSEGLPSEADLCIKYNVSRSATREAVKMLSAKGLISSRPKQGIRVLPESSWNMFDTDVLRWILSSKPSLSLLKEFTQVRVALEPQAAALDDPLEADIAFHTSILVASNNRFFVQLTEFISTALRVSIRYTNHIKGVPGADVTKHADILDTIKSGNPERAKKAVETILEEALELIESKLD